MTQKKWLTTKEAAEILSISPQTLCNQRNLHEAFPYYKIGRSIRYLLEDIVEGMEKGRIQPSV